MIETFFVEKSKSIKGIRHSKMDSYHYIIFTYISLGGDKLFNRNQEYEMILLRYTWQTSSGG